MRFDVAGIAACVLAAPLGAGAETIVVVEGPRALVEALEARGHRVLALADVEAQLRGLDRDERAAVDRLAREGRDALYGGGDLATARARLEEALRRGGEGLPANDRARLQLDLGVAHLGAGDRDDAERAIGAALRLDPDLEQDPAVHGPPVRRLVDRLRARAPRSARRDDDAELRADLEAAPSNPEAALRVAAALDADLAVAARPAPNGRWTARVIGPRRREGRVTAASLAELAAGLDAERAARPSVAARRGPERVAPDEGDEGDGGGGLAWWIGGGVAIVVAGVVVGALVLSQGDDEEGMTLVARFEGE